MKDNIDKLPVTHVAVQEYLDLRAKALQNKARMP